MNRGIRHGTIISAADEGRRRARVDRLPPRGNRGQRRRDEAAESGRPLRILQLGLCLYLCDDRIGMQLEEFPDERFGIQADRARIGPDVRTTENARRPVGDIIALEPFEHRQLDLRVGRDRAEGHLLLFTVRPEPGAKA
jgi:hypothetical protein